MGLLVEVRGLGLNRALSPGPRTVLLAEADEVGGDPDVRIVGDEGEPEFGSYPFGEDDHVVGDEGEPEFLNGWTGDARFRGERDGSVTLDMEVANASATTDTIFVLPSAYWPASGDVALEDGLTIVTASGEVITASAQDEAGVSEGYAALYVPDQLPFYAFDAAPPGFYKVAGRVYLEGWVQGDNTLEFDDGVPLEDQSTILFTLPEGFRPPVNRLFATSAPDHQNHWVMVKSNGDVIGATTEAGGDLVEGEDPPRVAVLDHIAFRAAPGGS